MLESLKEKVEKGELEDEEILKLPTIQDWISYYSA